jgi:AraC family ethanolamine operon transcriptional activator
VLCFGIKIALELTMKPVSTLHRAHSTQSSRVHDTNLVRTHRASDVDEHAASLIDWNLSYDQLGRGSFAGQFTDIRLPGVQIFLESTNQPVRQRGTLTQDSIGFAIMVSGQGTGALNGLRFDNESLLACRGTDMDLRTPAQCQLAGLVLDASLLDDATHQGDSDQHPVRPSSVAHLALKGAPAVRLRQVIHDTLELANDTVRNADDLTTRHWRDELLDALAGVMNSTRPIGDVRRANERTRLVNAACQLMLSNTQDGTPQSLGEVCRQVGASPRKLGYCFQEVLGMSALEYMKALRLNTVRRELRQATGSNTSIYDVATRHGFWHFGRFSVEYRQHFGERPSDTLRQAKSDLSQPKFARYG